MKHKDCTLTHFLLAYTQYRNIRNGGGFPVLGLFLKFLIFHYLRFLALQCRFLNFSRFSPWLFIFSKKTFLAKKTSLLHLLKHISRCSDFLRSTNNLKKSSSWFRTYVNQLICQNHEEDFF